MKVERETQGQEIRRTAKENGRSLKFIHTTLKMAPTIFYDCLKNERFTEAEMKTIRNIIVNGKID